MKHQFVDILLLGGKKCGHVVSTGRTSGELNFQGEGRYDIEKLMDDGQEVLVAVYSDISTEKALHLYKRHRYG